jgi:esterase/lipase superfamily enzyme
MARLFIIAILSMLLQGCAGRVPIGLVGAAEPRDREQLVNVPFFTNRAIDADDRGRTYYGSGRGSAGAGSCTVNLRKPEALDGAAKVIAVQQQTAADVLASLDASKPVVLYVHGYNIGFEKGCRRAARIQQNLGIVGQLVLFSWPADGKFLNYMRDVADLEWSVSELRTTLLLLTERFGAEQMVLLGHSLGARGLYQALIELAQTADLDTRFGHLVLAAPDIDRDRFLQDAASLARLVEQTTVYVSSRDRALAISGELYGYPRLGQVSDQVPPSGVAVVDLSAMEMKEISGHLYHLYNPAVVEDLRGLLGTLQGSPVFQRTPGPGPAVFTLNRRSQT